MATKQLKISNEAHEKLSTYSQKTGINMNIIVETLIDRLIENDLIREDWKEALTRDAIIEALNNEDAELKNKIEMEQLKTVNKAKLMMLGQYLKSMPDNDRKVLLESMLGKPVDANFLETFQNSVIYTIDGKKRILKMAENGFPLIPGINPALIIQCEKGFHILGAFCNCDIWRTCPPRQKEYEEWVSLHGTESQRNRYIEEQSTQRKRIESNQKVIS